MFLKLSKRTDPSWSLASRLVLWFTLSSFFLVVLGTASIYWSVLKGLDDVDDTFLTEKAANLTEFLRTNPIAEFRSSPQLTAGQSTDSYAQVFLRIRNREGRTFYETPGMDAELPVHLFEGAGVSRPLHSLSGNRFQGLRKIVDVGSGGPLYIVEVALSRQHEINLQSRLRLYAGFLLVPVSVLCLVLGYAIANRGLRPLRLIADKAQKIDPSNLHERLNVTGLPSEIYSLTTTFNAMLDRLEKAFSGLNRFNADLSHELRTPLNNLIGEISVSLQKSRNEADYRTTLGSCLEEGQRLVRIIESLLFLARSDSPRNRIRKERFLVHAELKKLRDFYEAEATDRGVRLELISTGECLELEADRTLFQRAVGNLLENAINHTEPQGTVSIRIESTNGIEIRIKDTGCGIAEVHLDKVFDQFYRVERTGEGENHLGLGLSLVSAIMRVHRGNVRLTSTPLKGTEVTLQFQATSNRNSDFEGGHGLRQRFKKTLPLGSKVARHQIYSQS